MEKRDREVQVPIGGQQKAQRRPKNINGEGEIYEEIFVQFPELKENKRPQRGHIPRWTYKYSTLRFLVILTSNQAKAFLFWG